MTLHRPEDDPSKAVSGLDNLRIAPGNELVFTYLPAYLPNSLSDCPKKGQAKLKSLCSIDILVSSRPRPRCFFASGRDKDGQHRYCFHCN